MDEKQRVEELQDTDFKYVMQDTGNIYIGARLTYAELMEQEMLPFKMKTIIQHYFLKDPRWKLRWKVNFITWKRAAFYMKPLSSFGSK